MDVEHFDRLIRKRHMLLIMACCPPCDPDDLVQECLIRLYERWDRFDEKRASRDTWAEVVARGAILDLHDGEVSRIGRQDVCARSIFVRSCYDKDCADIPDLPERQAEILSMLVNTQLTPAQIAKRLGMTPMNLGRDISLIAKKIEAHGKRVDL